MRRLRCPWAARLYRQPGRKPVACIVCRRQADKATGSEDRQAGRQTGRQAGWQAERRTGEQVYGQACAPNAAGSDRLTQLQGIPQAPLSTAGEGGWGPALAASPDSLCRRRLPAAAWLSSAQSSSNCRAD